MNNLIRPSVVSGVVLLLSLSGSAFASGRIARAGATFPAQIYQSWYGMLAGNDGPMFNYQAIGCGSGRKAYLDQTVNFGASDAR